MIHIDHNIKSHSLLNIEGNNSIAYVFTCYLFIHIILDVQMNRDSHIDWHSISKVSTTQMVHCDWFITTV